MKMTKIKMKYENVLMIIFIICIIIFVIKYNVNTGFTNDYALAKTHDRSVIDEHPISKVFSDYEKKLFWFVDSNIKYCEDLLKLKLPESIRRNFQSRLPVFGEMLRQVTEKTEAVEGHMGNYQPKIRTYLQLVNASFVKNICQTGFNAGHSVLMALVANPHAHVYSFALGEHAYSRPMAHYLETTFPGRLTTIWGDSKSTLPQFIRNNPTLRCELMLVDGDHSYEGAKADLYNFLTLANTDNNMVLVDDCPSGWYPGILKAWNDLANLGQVIQHWSCHFKEFGLDDVRGIRVGRYEKEQRFAKEQ